MGNSVLYSNSELRKLIVPMFFSTLLFITVGAMDSMMVAAIGAESVSGVALVDMVNVLFGGMLMALGTGGAVVASQYIGAGRPKDANDSANQLMILAEAVSILFMLFCLFFKRFALHLFFGNIPAEVEVEAMKYFRVTTFMFPLLGINTATGAILRSIDRANVTLVAAVIVNVLNLIGNYFFIFVFHWGVTGAGLSTVISRVIVAMYLLVMISDSSNKVYVSIKSGIRLNLQKMRKILFIGIPSGLETGIFTMGRLLVVGVVARFGTEQLAANSIGNAISSIGCIMGNSFALAMIPVVGRAVGTGSIANIRAYIWKMSKWAWVSYAIWNGALFAVLPFILGCYTKLTPETRHLAFTLCSMHILFGIVMWSISFTFPAALRACNDVRFTMCASIGSMIFIRIGMAYLLGWHFGLGAIGTWIAMICDWVVRIVCFIWRYRSGAWEKHALAALK